jgi:hypothetical protein
MKKLVLLFGLVVMLTACDGVDKDTTSDLVALQLAAIDVEVDAIASGVGVNSKKYNYISSAPDAIIEACRMEEMSISQFLTTQITEEVLNALVEDSETTEGKYAAQQINETVKKIAIQFEVYKQAITLTYEKIDDNIYRVTDLTTGMRFTLKTSGNYHVVVPISEDLEGYVDKVFELRHPEVKLAGELIEGLLDAIF